MVARDPEASEQVWSAQVGYPGNPVYREFHRDIGFELPAAAIGTVLRPGANPGFTGFKYQRVTGREPKELYDPQAAQAQAAEDGRDFAGRRMAVRAKRRCSGVGDGMVRGGPLPETSAPEGASRNRRRKRVSKSRADVDR